MKIGDYIYNKADVISKEVSSFVYAGMRISDNKPVAIKIVNLRNLNQIEKILLQDQKKALIKLKGKKNTIQLLNLIQSQQNIYMVTELYTNGTLKDYIKKKGSLKQQQAHDILIQILKAYLQLTQAGILHRNLKPENIMMTQNNLPVIIDFGCCHIIQSRKSNLIRVGSESYMAPQSYKRTFYSQKSDIWSIGLIMFEMLTGRRLDEGMRIRQYFQAINEEFICTKIGKLGNFSSKFLYQALRIDPDLRLSQHKLKFIINMNMEKLKTGDNNKVVEKIKLNNFQERNNIQIHQNRQIHSQQKNILKSKAHRLPQRQLVKSILIDSVVMPNNKTNELLNNMKIKNIKKNGSQQKFTILQSKVIANLQLVQSVFVDRKRILSMDNQVKMRFNGNNNINIKTNDKVNYKDNININNMANFNVSTNVNANNLRKNHSQQQIIIQQRNFIDNKINNNIINNNSNNNLINNNNKNNDNKINIINKNDNKINNNINNNIRNNHSQQKQIVFRRSQSPADKIFNQLSFRNQVINFRPNNNPKPIKSSNHINIKADRIILNNQQNKSPNKYGNNIRHQVIKSANNIREQKQANFNNNNNINNNMINRQTQTQVQKLQEMSRMAVSIILGQPQRKQENLTFGQNIINSFIGLFK